MDKVNIEISEGLIRPVIEAKIKEAIFQAIGGNEKELVSKMLEKILHDEVNADGDKSRYSSENKYNWIDVICGKAIKKAVNEAIVEWVNTNTPLLKERVKKYFEKRADKFSRVLVDGFRDSIDSQFGFDVTMTFNKKED